MEYRYVTESSTPVHVLADKSHRSPRTAEQGGDAQLGRLVVKDIENMGHMRVVIMGDNEPAMKALAHRMGAHPTVVEESPEYEPQANGLAERRVQTITGMVLTWRSALEGRISARVPDEHRLLSCLIRHAACLHNRYHVGQDGRTPSERVAGRLSAAAVAEFGERVMSMVAAPNKDRQRSLGIWLGLVTRTQESLAGTPEGVIRTWTLKRIGTQERWSSEGLLAIRCTTRQPDPRRGGECTCASRQTVNPRRRRGRWCRCPLRR